MNARKKLVCLLGGLLLAVPAGAGQWFSLAPRDSRSADTLVEVDLATVRLRGESGEAVIRVTHDVLQPHAAGFGYRSFVATAQIDCQRPSVALVSAAYFALPRGQGLRVGADSTGRQGGMPRRVLESIPAHSRQALIKAACSAPGT